MTADAAPARYLQRLPTPAELDRLRTDGDWKPLAAKDRIRVRAHRPPDGRSAHDVVEVESVQPGGDPAELLALFHEDFPARYPDYFDFYRGGEVLARYPDERALLVHHWYAMPAPYKDREYVTIQRRHDLDDGRIVIAMASVDHPVATNRAVRAELAAMAYVIAPRTPTPGETTLVRLEWADPKVRFVPRAVRNRMHAQEAVRHMRMLRAGLGKRG